MHVTFMMLVAFFIKKTMQGRWKEKETHIHGPHGQIQQNAGIDVLGEWSPRGEILRSTRPLMASTRLARQEIPTAASARVL